jgi:protocatechuate 3,4-dioxygenase beta subunit
MVKILSSPIIRNRQRFILIAIAAIMCFFPAFSMRAQTVSSDKENICSGIPTPSSTEGPYYKEGSPRRTSLIEPGVRGTRIVITGKVFNTDCKPIVGAWLDFWQADGRGRYDNAGFKLRGHQYTDSDGHYYLETVIPGGYITRTPHIHVKVRAPGGSILTTQLYFPQQESNKDDRIFNSDLVMSVSETTEGKHATFNFVLRESD